MVEQGDYVGLFFVGNAGVVPFSGVDGGGASGSVWYTANNYAGSNPMTAGSSLSYQGGVNRVYSFSVTGLVWSGASCKMGGYASLTNPNTGQFFGNQGMCVSYFANAGMVPIGSANSSWQN